MSIETTTRTRSFEAFVAEFEPGMESQIFSGRSLILEAAGNLDPAARVRIMNFLLDHECRVDGVGGDGSGVFHVLFSVTKRDSIGETAELTSRLIEAGADVNHLDDRGRDALSELIIVGATDELLAPIYDLWFVQDLENIELPAKDGYSPLASAKLLPYRGDLVRRMEEKLNG